ncbi:MAG: radical SAM protein [Thermoleophilia bacterium]|nr:radical SAM protein [Thermoleophilia bacterium]
MDLNLEGDPFPALATALARFDPQLVGVGLRNIDPLANRRHSYLPVFAGVLEAVRAALPKVPLVVGGAGFSMFPLEIMRRYPAIDAGVLLEGELTFPELLARIEDGRGGPRGRPARSGRVEGGGYLGCAAGLPGTVVRVGPGPEGLVVGPRRGRVPQEALNRVRSWLPELAAPYSESSSYAPAAGVETKRGCPLRCSYCVYPALQGHRTRFRNPETIVGEVQLLHREAGVEWVHFTDPVLNDPPDHFREVCQRLIERGAPVRWTGFFREGVLTREDAELAVRAGCAAFQFSGDGTCDATLARLRKGLARDDILRAAGHAAATTALTVYHFMVNVPGTDAAVVRDAHDLVERLHDLHEPQGTLGAVVFNNLRVYPRTPLARELTRAGVLASGQDLLYPTYHNPAPYCHLRYELEERHQLRACRRRASTAAAENDRESAT